MALNRRPPVPAQAPPQYQSGWQDLNLRSQAPRACAIPDFATPWQSRRGRIRTADLVLPKHAGFQATPRTESKAPSGSRTHTSAMARQQATATSWAHRITGRIVKDREHRVGFEPTSPNYGCGILAAGLPVPVVQVGSEGLEPSPTWLRARHAAASTLIPCFLSLCLYSARRESNPRPGPYKRPALTTELRASGAEGSRTLTIPLKRRKRYRYATTPSVGVSVCV